MKTAWMLPGGATFGANQVGQVQALMDFGIYPDLLYGASVGSLNAAWLSEYPTREGAAGLEQLWRRTTRGEIFPFRPVTIIAGVAGKRDHLIGNDAFANWIRRSAPNACLEDGKVPLTVSATELVTGAPVFMESGDARSALLASCSIPGFFPPVEREGLLLVDGGLAANTPVRRAIEAGAERVYILPAMGQSPPNRPMAALAVMLRSINGAIAWSLQQELGSLADKAEIYVAPACPTAGLSPFSFRHVSRMLSGARTLTESWLPRSRPIEAAVPSVTAP